MLRSALVVATIVSVLAATTPSHAGDPLLDCASKKLKGAATFAKLVIGCSATAAKKGAVVDPACFDKASSKLGDAFAKADAGGCDGNPSGIGAKMALADADLVSSALSATLGTVVDRCAALKLKNAGKYASSVLKGESKNIRAPDAEKLAATSAKARSKLVSGFDKADAKGGCSSSFAATQAVSILGPTVSSIVDCIAGGGTCEGGSGVVTPGGAFTTDVDADGATPADPIEADVTSPGGGTIAVVKSALGNGPGGIRQLARRLDIAAPPASAAAPLAVALVVDASEVAGLVPDDLHVFRNGVLLPPCSGAPGEASPDPCVAARTSLGDGDFSVLALTSHASLWTVGVSTGCPIAMQLTMHADDGVTATGSNLELGFTGAGHNNDPLDDYKVGVRLDCPGIFGPACGDCTVLGIDTASNACRCSNDNHAYCDVVNGPDADDCGGATCDCYVTPPQPMSAFNTPSCVVPRLATDVSGTWDPDDGDGSLELDQRWRVYIGGTITTPCPVCSGDSIAHDGVRDGTCVGGLNAGQSCDVDGADPVLAAGAGTSLDCLPTPGTNVSGSGLRVELPLTTGVSSLPFANQCDSPLGFLDCACGVCSLDVTRPCRNDAECASASAGTCTSNGAGVGRQPNACADLVCTDIGSEHGACLGGGSLVDKYCDGILRVDGEGLATCLNNADCGALGPGFGNCTLSADRRCFLDPIVATGDADPNDPTLVGTACVPPTTNAATNTAYGLPGPLRLTAATSAGYEQSDACPTTLTFTSLADDGVVATDSNVEIGWTGLDHNSDPIAEARFRIGINCGAALPPACGGCPITGLLTTPGNCRCESNNRTICDVVNGPDADDCAGGTCRCYAAAPQPFSAGGTTFCVTPRFESNVSGTWNPSVGTGLIGADQRWLTYVGLSLVQPCPVCAGDSVAHDGVRGGICSGGLNAGQSCDVDGIDPILAAAGGTSLDCFPTPGTNVSGAGLRIDLPFTTGLSSLPFANQCEAPLGSLSCACGMCSLDPTLACRNDAECASAAAGTCTSSFPGVDRRPNSCDDLTCSDVGGEHGECLTGGGTDDDYCDGVVRIDGGGIFVCVNNADCPAGTGACTLTETRRCFLDPIQVVGDADATEPLLVTTTCIAPTTNGAINAANGLPGPSRLGYRYAVSTP